VIEHKKIREYACSMYGAKRGRHWRSGRLESRHAVAGFCEERRGKYREHVDDYKKNNDKHNGWVELSKRKQTAEKGDVKNYKNRG
jgi:hypothetical protein